jgi:undecaprenyl-diphosphatase
MEADPAIGYLWAAVLGLVQGLAEFLPVSSSGHLALVAHLGMGSAAPAAFDVFLHLATLIVVIVYFRRGILWYAENSPVVLLYVIVASVPTGLVGVACKQYLEALRLSPTLICLGLLVTAMALFIAELHRGAAYQMRDLGWLGAATLGVCQALAIAPGVSRSGATIAGAIICGIDRKEAFGFSFILSIPAVAGAVLLHIVEAFGADGGGAFLAEVPLGPLLVGITVAAASGYFALRTLERMVVGGRLAWFAGYCLLAAVSGLVYFNLL